MNFKQPSGPALQIRILPVLCLSRPPRQRGFSSWIATASPSEERQGPLRSPRRASPGMRGEGRSHSRWSARRPPTKETLQHAAWRGSHVIWMPDMKPNRPRASVPRTVHMPPCDHHPPFSHWLAELLGPPRWAAVQFPIRMEVAVVISTTTLPRDPHDCHVGCAIEPIRCWVLNACGSVPRIILLGGVGAQLPQPRNRGGHPPPHTPMSWGPAPRWRHDKAARQSHAGGGRRGEERWCGPGPRRWPHRPTFATPRDAGQRAALRRGGGVARRVTHAAASSVASSLFRVGIFLKPHGARSMSSAAPHSGGTAREVRSRGGGRGEVRQVGLFAGADE